jgi:hypothetical protein
LPEASIKTKDNLKIKNKGEKTMNYIWKKDKTKEFKTLDDKIFAIFCIYKLNNENEAIDTNKVFIAECSKDYGDECILQIVEYIDRDYADKIWASITKTPIDSFSLLVSLFDDDSPMAMRRLPEYQENDFKNIVFKKAAS